MCPSLLEIRLVTSEIRRKILKLTDEITVIKTKSNSTKLDQIENNFFKYLFELVQARLSTFMSIVSNRNM